MKDKVPPQYFLARYQDGDLTFMNFYVRTEFSPESQLSSISAAVAALDSNLPVNGLSTLPGVIRSTLFTDRLISMLAGVFALLATFLAAIGLYGVLSYSVTQRTRELGLRQALGATSGRLRRMVLCQVGWMGLIGGAIGLALAVSIGRAAEAVLFGVSGQDPFVLAAATILLGAVLLAAGYMPARRASNADPLEALRCE